MSGAMSAVGAVSAISPVVVEMNTINSVNVEQGGSSAANAIDLDQSDSVRLISAEKKNGWQITAKMAWHVFSKVVIATAVITAAQAVSTGAIAGFLIWQGDRSPALISTVINVMSATVAFGVVVGGVWGGRQAVAEYKDYKKTAYQQMTDAV